MAAHEKYQQYLLELSIVTYSKQHYVSEANCFILQVKIPISPEERSSALSKLSVLF
jgi:hypothetical protein